jgi:hypothetical protein
MGAINTTQAGGTAAFKDLSSVMDIASAKFGYVANGNDTSG